EGELTFAVDRRQERTSILHLDTYRLKIEKIVLIAPNGDETEVTPTEFSETASLQPGQAWVEPSQQFVGSPLKINLPRGVARVRVKYQTSENAFSRGPDTHVQAGLIFANGEGFNQFEPNQAMTVMPSQNGWGYHFDVKIGVPEGYEIVGSTGLHGGPEHLSPR